MGNIPGSIFVGQCMHVWGCGMLMMGGVRGVIVMYNITAVLLMRVITRNVVVFAAIMSITDPTHRECC